MASRITLLAVRVRSRTAKDLWSLGRILLGLALTFAAIGGCQLGLCWRRTPKASAKQCIAPLLKQDQ